MKPLLLALAPLLLCLAARAEHRDDRGREPGTRREAGRVILYQHPGFRGDALELFPGDSIADLARLTFERGARLNDGISSIRIEGDVEIVAYDGSHYRGEALRLTESARELNGRLVVGGAGARWDDRISSLHIERSRGRGDDHPRGQPEKLVQQTFDDLLGRPPTSGELRDFRGRIIDQGWTERMLRDHLRTDERYRIEAADLIIHRSYRDVLGRDADPSGLRTHRRNLLERGWTEADVREHLRRSPEYRSKPRS